jgi:hypothetical protein
MRPRTALLFASLAAGVGAYLALPGSPTVAAEAPKPAISADASAAIAQMSKTLQTQSFSFAAHTIREYPDQTGDLLHIFHSFKVTVRRPDRLLVEGTGDDGARKLIYDDKTLVLAMDGGKKYASVAVPDTIDSMMHEAVGRLRVDFPLADLLTNDPAKSVLSSVTAGRVVNIVTIGDEPCRHLFFTQPGIELELWVENSERAVPRRLVVTYRSVAGEPSFIAQMSDWNFDVHPADGDFAFQPPAGAVKVVLKPAAVAAHPAGGK